MTPVKNGGITIRSAERVFWRKVLDIYATSMDYDPKTEVSQQFFASVQNRMHWAAHGHTVAEIIHARADAAQPNMGMTNWIGTQPGKAEIAIAKWQEAERQYGSVPRKALRTSLEDMLARPALYLERASDMKMKPDWAQRIVTEGARRLHSVI